jgi:nucleoid-associated protein YgaU
MVAITTAEASRMPRFPSRPAVVVLPPVTRPEARIYRRRRLAVLVAALSLLGLPAALVATAGSSPAATREAPSLAGATVAAPVYVVQPGDTLWSIARKVDPGADVRVTVDRLVELNGGAALQPGQRLRLDGEPSP